MTRNSVLILFVIFLLMACSNHSSDQVDVYKIRLNKKETNKINTRQKTDNVLQVAIATMISPKETFVYYKDLLNYIGKRLNRVVVFKQRKTYKEVNDMIKKKQLDLAFVCSGAYVQARKEFPIEILAVPVVNGKPFYRAYIIVHRMSQFRKFQDLRGHSFAFTDPLSNTGFFFVRDLLEEMGTGPEQFFSKTIFTYAHDYSIQAVSRKIVDGASVDGLVYDYLKETQPEKVENTRIIKKSGFFGIPPIVTHADESFKLKQKLKNILITMHRDSTGRRILRQLNIDRFEAGDPHNYDMIE